MCFWHLLLAAHEASAEAGQVWSGPVECARPIAQTEVCVWQHTELAKTNRIENGVLHIQILEEGGPLCLRLGDDRAWHGGYDGEDNAKEGDTL